MTEPCAEIQKIRWATDSSGSGMKSLKIILFQHGTRALSLDD